MKFPEKSLPTLFIEEPPLEFAYGQTCPNPKDGLYLYGPHQRPKRVKEIRVGVVGTNAGIGYFKAWAEKLKRRVHVPPPGKTDKPNRLHLANFPGIEEAFAISYTVDDFVCYSLEKSHITDATSLLNQHEAVAKTVALYTDKVKRHDKDEEQAIDVWVFVLPEEIFERCKPEAKRTGVPKLRGRFAGRQKERFDAPLFAGILDQGEEAVFDDVPDFHRQVKAQFLKLGHTTQMLRETTLAPEEFTNAAGYPVLRGSAVVLDDQNAYLWTNGYAPQLDTYIGPETPNPLFVSVLRSKEAFPKIEGVLRDIMGLTKINYNACNFNDSLPVTVRFADKVGDVLVMGSAKDAERQPFKFYV